MIAARTIDLRQAAYASSLGILAVFDLALLSFMQASRHYEWAAENGPVENFEAALLGTAVLLFAWRTMQSASLSRLINGGLAGISAMFLLRELDFRQTSLSSRIVHHLQEAKYLFSAVILLVLAAYLIIHWRQWIATLRHLLQPKLLAYVAGGVLLYVGSFFEAYAHGALGIMVALEEISEMNGFLVLIFAGVFFPYREFDIGGA
jgi:hypothetical protein